MFSTKTDKYCEKKVQSMWTRLLMNGCMRRQMIIITVVTINPTNGHIYKHFKMITLNCLTDIGEKIKNMYTLTFAILHQWEDRLMDTQMIHINTHQCYHMDMYTHTTQQMHWRIQWSSPHWDKHPAQQPLFWFLLHASSVLHLLPEIIILQTLASVFT